MCPICDKYASPGFRPGLRHIGEVHQFEPGFTIMCGVDGCPNKYTSVSGYKTYLYRSTDSSCNWRKLTSTIVKLQGMRSLEMLGKLHN